MYKLAFEISGLPKTINSSGRTHWSVKVKEIKMWKTAVYAHVYPFIPDEPLTKAKIVLTRFSSSCPDFDGLVISFKHVLDGLVDAAIIKNDSMDVIGKPEYNWIKCKPKEGKIVVSIEEVAQA